MFYLEARFLVIVLESGGIVPKPPKSRQMSVVPHCAAIKKSDRDDRRETELLTERCQNMINGGDYVDIRDIGEQA